MHKLLFYAENFVLVINSFYSKPDSIEIWTLFCYGIEMSINQTVAIYLDAHDEF